MTGVQVIISNNKIHLANDNQAIVGDQLLIWHVESEDPNIERVQISFEDTARHYFTDNGKPSHQKTKDLQYNAKNRATQLFWSQVPLSPNEIQGDKYSVLGFDAKGCVVELDPKILVIRP